MRTNKVYRSETWFELFGYEPGELADNPWAWENMIHPDDAAEVLDVALAAYVRDGVLAPAA